jgi:hypothetical protein
MKHIKLIVTAILLVCMLMGCARKNEISLKKTTTEYNGISDDIDVTLYDIVSEVGANIDYTSSIIVKNEDKYDNFEIWVNASEVDIYTPGEYKATYTFYYGSKSYEATIKVTILEEGVTGEGGSESSNTTTSREPSAGENVETEQTTKPTSTNPTTKPSTDKTTTKPATKPNVEETTTKPTTKPNVDESTTKPTTIKPTTKPNGGESTTKPTTKPTATSSSRPATVITSSNSGNAGESETTTRTFIPATSQNETTVTDLGYMYIELLSGGKVKVKCTTARYIVATRTDVSIVTKKGVKYEVSKLIVTFNTGAEQVLETSEKRMN